MRFIFIDKILELEKGKRALMVKNVSNSEDYFTHHFPDFPVMPGALMLEAVDQAAGLLISYSMNFEGLAVLKRVSNAKFRGVLRPGDQLVMEIMLDDLNEKSADVTAKLRSEDKQVAAMKLFFSIERQMDSHIAKEVEKMKYLYELLSHRIYKQSFFK